MLLNISKSHFDNNDWISLKYYLNLFHIVRRNEQIIGMKPFLGKQTGAGVVTVAGDDPKRFQAAMVEYNKEKVRNAQLFIWH